MVILHFLLYNGIGQNIVAAGVLGVPGFIWGRRKVLNAWHEHQAHMQRTKEIHEHLTADFKIPATHMLAGAEKPVPIRLRRIRHDRGPGDAA